MRAGGAGPGWHEGYVVDVPYTEPVALDLTPTFFSLAAVLHGQPPIDGVRPLVWAELGCGNGLSACIVAAVNSGVEVWGCDFNPAHVERARQVATKAGLSNCTFDEASFEEVAGSERLGPAEVDVVVVHGVYSWVSLVNQKHIGAFIRRRLRPGGFAYLSYETAGGWSSMVPLAEAMRLHARADGRRSDLAFATAAAALHELADGGAHYFPLGAHETTAFAELSTADGRYAAHEYLGAHFRPLMFDEVADVMSAARCSYVGSVEATDYLSGLWAPPELIELVNRTSDGVLRQMLRDLIVQRTLRRDLFRRGLALPTNAEREDWLQQLVVVGLGKSLDDRAIVDLPVGEITLDREYYEPLVQALSEAPLDVTGIRAVHPEASVQDAVATLALLVNGGYAAPQVQGDVEVDTMAAARRLNEVLVAENRRGADHHLLVAPAIGGAISSEFVEMLALGAVWDGVPADVVALSDHAMAELGRLEFLVREDGAFVEEPAAARAIVEGRVAGALERMTGVFAQLGVC
jgi:SAM-dependent methyltransferase